MGLFQSEKCVVWPFPPLFFQQLFCLLVIIINLFFLEDQPRSWLFLCPFVKTYATKFQIVLPVLSNYISYFFHCCEKSSIRKEEFNLTHSLRGYSSLWQWSHGNREMRRLIILFPKSGIVRGNMVGGIPELRSAAFFLSHYYSVLEPSIWDDPTHTWVQFILTLNTLRDIPRDTYLRWWYKELS